MTKQDRRNLHVFIVLLLLSLVSLSGCQPDGSTMEHLPDASNQGLPPDVSTENPFQDVSTEKLFDVEEMIGRLTGSSAEIFVHLGRHVTPDHQFKLAYSTATHSNDQDYEYETPVQTGYGPETKLVFGNLTGLSPGTKYYYCIAHRQGSEEAWTWRNEYSFKTTPPPGVPFRFCVVADYHHSGATTELTTLTGIISTNVAADQPDFVVALGDMHVFSNQGTDHPVACRIAYLLNRGRPSQVASRWERFAALLMNPFSCTSMLVWINGNHEGLAGYLSECAQYESVLRGRKEYLPLLDQDEPTAFYGDLVWGDLHLIWLDPLAFSTSDPFVVNDSSGYCLGDEQEEWLKTTLTDSDSRYKLIFAHSVFGGADESCTCAPRGNYARGGPASVATPGTDQVYIQALMKDHGVNGYFYAHDHMHSIFEYDGVNYVVVGAGNMSPWGACLENHYDPAPVIRMPGHLRVDVGMDSLALTYIKGSNDSSNLEVLGMQYID